LKRLLVLAAAALLLSACDKATPPARPAGLTQSDYAAPPELTSATRAADGTVTLSGAGIPLARIRLASPTGASIGATAAANGRWNAALPPAAEVRLLSLSQDVDGRLVRARGYVAVLPPPGPVAATLRAGTGARPVFSPASLSIGSIEFDGAGAGVVSGSAAPDTPIRLFLDGQDAGEGRTDRTGRFDITLADNLSPSGHSIIVVSPAGRATQAFDATPAAAITTPPFAAERRTGAWRIDWMTPGGGVQSTILFDAAGSAG
jgi:hypothetical protein